jgi:hypothetical protein
MKSYLTPIFRPLCRRSLMLSVEGKASSASLVSFCRSTHSPLPPSDEAPPSPIAGGPNKTTGSQCDPQNEESVATPPHAPPLDLDITPPQSKGPPPEAAVSLQPPSDPSTLTSCRTRLPSRSQARTEDLSGTPWPFGKESKPIMLTVCLLHE